MIEIKTNRNTALVFTDSLDAATHKQIAATARIPAYADSKIRVMPDTHAGRGCVIGMTMTLHGRVAPSLVGVDIGCGMEVVRLSSDTIDLTRLDAFIHEHIPHGKHIRSTAMPASEGLPLAQLKCHTCIDMTRACLSLGTLGGGNHFIEIDRAPDGGLYLVIHSGSRSLGAAVAKHYQDEAYRIACRKARHESRVNHADRWDAEQDPYDIARFGVDTFGDDLTGSSRIRAADHLTKAARREDKSRLPVKWECAVCEGELFADYLHDQAICICFAEASRRAIAEDIMDAMGLTASERFSCVHNYIDADGILRKGATSARLGERVFIPLSMRDGALIGRGLGNPDWNFSAPHGAGRACSRSDAKHAYSVEEYLAVMREAGVYSTTIGKETLDECPMAYKSPERILPHLSDCVTVDAHIRPIYNFKSPE